VKSGIGLLLCALVLALSGQIASGHRTRTTQAMTAGCSATMLTLHPGLNPPESRIPLSTAADIPRGRFTVSLPVYPRSTPLVSYVGSPFPELWNDPYLQTASTEYQSVDDFLKVETRIAAAFRACGWHDQGSWNGNTSPFSSGITLISDTNPDLSIEISFGDRPSGGTYIGYGVEEITLPPRPRRSFLHGPFAEVRIVLVRYTIQKGQPSPIRHVVHVTLSRRSAIVRLITAVNAIKGYRTVRPVCFGGGLGLDGPIWMSFVRSNGSEVHAFESGPGSCFGGLAVNGARWLVDIGAVWKQVHVLAAGRR
jgi:hypothetical protein